VPNVHIRQVHHQAEAGQQLVGLPQDVIDALYELLNAYVGRELETGNHVQRLSVEGRAIRVNFFVDTDGTLWIERMGPGV